MAVEGREIRSKETSPPNRPRVRWIYAILAYVFAALALIGLVVPGIPTTPFVLLAGWAASRGSERMHVWLRDHPRLGPPLRDWREQGAVSTRAKILAVVLLIVSWAIAFSLGTAPWILMTLAALFTGVAIFVGTRPSPRR